MCDANTERFPNRCSDRKEKINERTWLATGWSAVFAIVAIVVHLIRFYMIKHDTVSEWQFCQAEGETSRWGSWKDERPFEQRFGGTEASGNS
jgi:hypothetical protein